MPAIKPIMDRWCLRNVRPGSSSSMEMKTMIPETPAITMPSRRDSRTGKDKYRYQRSQGLCNPERKENQNAFFLLPVHGKWVQRRQYLPGCCEWLWQGLWGCPHPGFHPGHEGGYSFGKICMAMLRASMTPILFRRLFLSISSERCIS